ncbi:MAG TPA: ABC transporter permease [Baekduia sp.]|jgi:ribose transport system permease protein
MSQAVATEAVPPVEEPAAPGADTPPGRSLASKLSFGNIGAVYVFAAIIVVFSIWAPDTFPTWTTARTVINQNAVAGIIALSLVVPLSAAAFDLSIGSIMGLASIVCAWLLVKKGLPVVPAILLSLVVGLVAGLVNSVLVVVVGIESFIATLATGSLMTAAVSMISDYTPISGAELSKPGFSNIANAPVVAGIDAAAVMLLVVALGLYLFQEYTPSGRRMFATGFNIEAARLTGIRVNRLRFTGLMVSALVASIAGVLITAQMQVGQPDVGSPYLLNAFSAVFLGATQFRSGRFNAAGTLLAVLLLGTGKTGLTLVGAQPWGGDMFVGVVLIGALALAAYERVRGQRKLLAARRRATKRRAEVAAEPA